MKTFILGSLLAIGLVFTTNAQTSTNTPGPANVETNAALLFGSPAKPFLDFLTANSSNWMAVAGGTIDLDQSGYGGFFALAYKINDYLWSAGRLDYLHGDLTLVTANVQLGLPIKIVNKFTAYPMVYAAAGTPISGAGSKDGTLASILGAGMAIRLSDKWDLIASYEKIGSLDLGNKGQVRAGLGFKF